MAGFQDDQRVTAAEAPRRSDIRRAAQLRDSGVTPSLFRSALRSDHRRGVLLKVPQNNPDKSSTNTDVVTDEPISPSSAARLLSSNSISVKKEKHQHRQTVKTKSAAPVSKPATVDLTEDDIDAMIDDRTPTELQQALANFEPQGWLNDTAIDALLEHLVSRNPSVGRVGSWDVGIIRRSRNERLPAILRNRFAFLAQKDVWIAPVCHGNHWVLFVGRRDEALDYYDSIVSGGNKTQTTRILHEFLRCVWGDDVVLPEPRVRPCPQQPNGYDCGLHVVRNADIVTLANRSAHDILPLHPTKLRDYYKAMYQSLLEQ